jgi:signal transduction histidine kinase/CheY-like chemotaxis protein
MRRGRGLGGIGSVEALLILLLCASVAVAARVLARSEGTPLTWWLSGWLAAGAATILVLLRDEFPHAPLLAYPLGSSFPALLLGGALALGGRQVPRWLLPGAFALGLLRSAVAAAGQTRLSWGLALAIEPACALASAWLVWRAIPRTGASLSERLLAPSIVLLGALGAVHIVAMMQTGRVSPGLLAMWVVSVPSLLGVQLHAEWERSRRRWRGVQEELECRVEERTAALRESERRMFESQRLESLALLSGGVAHDFDNLLLVILGNSRAAQAEAPPGSALASRLARIGAAAEHGARLTQQMLAYSGRSSLARKPIDLSQLALETSDLLHASVSERCRVEIELAPCAPAEGDATQLQQVLLNLATNASDACGAAGGHLVVRTGSCEPGARELADVVGSESAQPGRYVFLDVSDDGPGMDAATRQRMFEPFFTTKPSGRGLGLAAVLGIVRAHGGVVRVRTRPGAGTTVSVLLPEAPSAIARARAPAATPPVRRGCVLVIDDQESVVDVTQCLLRAAGHRAVGCTSGRAGIEIFRERADEIDAVLLDLTMPDTDGEQVLEALRRIRPDVRVVISTGHDASSVAARVRAQAAGFVRKPFDPDAMLAEVERALAADG